MSAPAPEVTTDGKQCVECGGSFDDDKRYSRCSSCRGAVKEVEPEPIRAGLVPLSLELEKFPTPRKETQRSYWCGITTDAPTVCAHLGGFEFPRDEGMLSAQDGKPTMIDHVKKGKVLKLTDAEVALIKERLADKIVRGRGIVCRSGTGWFVDIDGKSKCGKPYTPQDGDRPLGCYVYMAKVEGSVDQINSEPPPTMVPRDW